MNIRFQLMKNRLLYFYRFLVTSFLLVSLISLGGRVQAQKVPLTILHYNDFHAQNVPMKIPRTDSAGNRTVVEVGGSAYMKAYIDKFRKEAQNTIVLHAGDDFQGTPISSITKGKSQIELLELIQPDVMTIGNHEFDYGTQNLRQLFPRATISLVSANLFDKSIGAPFLPRYRVLNRGGISIGVIGLAPRDLKGLTLRENVKDLDVLDADQVVRQTIVELKRNFHVNLIVVLSHLGVEEDTALARAVPGIDVIVGGHSHTPLFKPIRIGNTYVVQAGSKGRWLGKLDLVYDMEKSAIVSGSGKLIETMNSGIIPDSIVAAKVAELESLVDAGLNEVIGTLETDWVPAHGPKESNVGNWQADVIRDFCKTDIAFQNNGGIRKGLPAGPITLRDMWEMNPFGNEFSTFSVTGSQLVTMLTTQAAKEREFCQVSGLKYMYDFSLPKEKALQIWVDGKPMESEKHYTVSTNTYVAGHLYDIFRLPEKDIEVRAMYPVELDRDVFIRRIKTQKRVSSVVEGRIIIRGKNED